MPAPLRVTMLSGDFYPDQIGGQGIYAFEIAARVAAAGHIITVVCPDAGGRARHDYPPGLTVRRLPKRAANPLIFSARATTERNALLSSTDVLHVNELFGFPLAVRTPGERHGIVISSHNAYLDRFHAAKGLKKLKYPPLIALERLSYPRADRVIIGSEIEREPVLRLGVEADRVVAIPYGVDRARFSDDGTLRRDTRARLGIPRDAPVVLFVGRFVERKKAHVVASALRVLRERDPSVHGILVGDGETMDRVRAAAGADPAIHMVGSVAFSDLPAYYAAADAFTLPSVGEGSISLVVLEAAAAGLPLVLTADSCGGSLVFESGKNGELVLLDDARGLSSALRVALSQRVAYGRRSRDIVERHFSWDACARATVQVYLDARSARDARKSSS
ncbi:MAG TPA: glycosyltransferase family 4 protein [Polyangiaceae bacterium]|jgi:glycosyltransferase involved in cell wall biosynthesis|nr:glycosyltransferase family 4 protein [Polyangiaceae bacterium]